MYSEKLNGSKLHNYCQILKKLRVLKPGEELCKGGNDPLGEQPDRDQESKHAGQEGDGRDHVGDDRPQGDEVDEDTGCQHLFHLLTSLYNCHRIYLHRSLPHQNNSF